MLILGCGLGSIGASPRSIVDIYDAILLSNAFNTNGQNHTKAHVKYDSGWVNITDKRGQSLDIVHNLNITDCNDEKILVDITGKTTIDGELLRYLDMAYSGQTQWNMTYGGPANAEWARSLVQTSDGGYALTGLTATTTDRDFWMVKTDANGNELWNKTYGGASYDEAYSVVQCSDGRYALAGYTRSFGAGSGDFWLVKTDSAGIAQWDKTYGGSDGELGQSVVQTDDGGYALAGLTASFGAGQGYFWLIKVDINADIKAEYGLAWRETGANVITLYRGAGDTCWNFVRVRICKARRQPIPSFSQSIDRKPVINYTRI